MPGIKANPALYTLVQGGSIEARSASVEDELRHIEEGLAQTYQANDAAYLGRVLADDYLVTDGPGTTSDKRKVLADHEGKRLHVDRFTFGKITIQRLGPDAAMVTGQYTWEASYDGRPIPGTFRYLRVYTRSDAGQHGWDLVAEAMEQRTHVGVEHALIVGAVLVGQRRAALLEACVEGRVKPPEAAQRCRDQFRHLRVPRDIGCDEQALRARCPDCGSGLFAYALAAAS